MSKVSFCSLGHIALALIKGQTSEPSYPTQILTDAWYTYTLFDFSLPQACPGANLGNQLLPTYLEDPEVSTKYSWVQGYMPKGNSYAPEHR